MVLLIPAEIKRLKEEGRKEGRQQERQRIVEVLRELGEGEEGSIQITLTPEVVQLPMSDDLRS